MISKLYISDLVGTFIDSILSQCGCL